jgi:hypothetical protein
MKMEFYQSRWVSLNLIAMSRIYSSQKLTPEEKDELKQLTRTYAA